MNASGPRYIYREEILRRRWRFHNFLVVLWGQDTELRVTFRERRRVDGWDEIKFRVL